MLNTRFVDMAICLLRPFLFTILLARSKRVLMCLKNVTSLCAIGFSDCMVVGTETRSRTDEVVVTGVEQGTTRGNQTNGDVVDLVRAVVVEMQDPGLSPRNPASIPAPRNGLVSDATLGITEGKCHGFKFCEIAFCKKNIFQFGLIFLLLHKHFGF